MSLGNYPYGLNQVDIAGMGGKKVDELVLLGLRALTLLKYEHRLLAKGKKLTNDGVQWCAGDEGADASFTTPLVHKANDTTNTVTSADASDQATLNTLLNEIKGDYNAHRVSTTFHDAADNTNVVDAADASDLATSQTLANQIKAKYNTHRSQSGVHPYDDALNEVTSADATDLATAQTLANEEKTDYNAHLTATVTATLFEAFKQYINPKISGTPNWVEIGLTIRLKASADNSAGKWKWQGSVNGTDWSDLFDLVTESDVDIAELERTRQGFALLSIITAIPFYLKLLVQCDTSGQTVTARVKSSSYATPVYQVT